MRGAWFRVVLALAGRHGEAGGPSTRASRSTGSSVVRPVEPDVRLAPVDPFSVVAAARQERARRVVQLLRRRARASRAAAVRDACPGANLQMSEPIR